MIFFSIQTNSKLVSSEILAEHNEFLHFLLHPTQSGMGRHTCCLTLPQVHGVSAHVKQIGSCFSEPRAKCG